MRFIRSLSNCTTCPLRDRTRVHGEGPDGAPLLLLGEAPGRDEDEQGRPFVGAAGRVLNWGLAQAGLHRSGLYLTNVLSCRPPDNRFDSDEGETAQVHCLHGFEEEIGFLRKEGMKVLLSLGANATHALGLSEPITKIRGSVYERDGYVIIPTYHPAYLARMRYAKKDSAVDLSAVWIADLKKAKYISSHGWHPPKEHFELFPTIQDLRSFATHAIVCKSLLAVDIETTGFDPDRAEIVVVGLADSAEHCVSVPFIEQGNFPYWSNGELMEVRRLLDKIFSTCPLMFQNALFDVPFLRKKGFKVGYENVKHDTLLLHHAISPELPHNLGFIVSIYGSTPYWKGDFLTRTGTILEMDDTVLRTYNARDCVVLHQVLGPMLEDLDESGTAAVYNHESLPLLNPVGAMIERGIRVDEAKLSSYKRSLEKRLREVGTKLYDGGRLPVAFNLDSGDDLRYFLFGNAPAKFGRLKDLTPTIDPKTGKEKSLRKDTKKYAELLALQTIKDQVHPMVNLRSFRGRTTDSGKCSTNDQGLLSLQLHLQNRIGEIDRLKQPTQEHRNEREAITALLSWLEQFREYRRLGKLLSTYTRYPTWQDKRIHTRLMIHGTATGRLSSSEPNLQNIPKKDIEAREPFVPAEGYVFLSADYVNLEVWVLALESQDEALLTQLRNGINIHDENTKLLFGLTPESPNWKIARRAAKIFQFGGIQYGGSDREIYEKVILEAPSLALTFSSFVNAKYRWTQAHQGYAQWARKVQRQAVETRRVEIAGGRVRTVYGAERDIQKQALNSPIQGGAAHVVNQATIRIHERMKDMKSGLVLQIHDELLFEVWVDELGKVQHLVKEEMERPVDWRGVSVVFPSEQQVGKSWADCYRKED